MLFEVEQAIWAVQQPPSAPPIVTRICMHCQRPLTEEEDMAFCTKCLNEPKPIREHVLVISIDGKTMVLGRDLHRPRRQELHWLIAAAMSEF